MSDLINNPPHYTNHPSGVECWDISMWLSGCLAQAFQYVWRAGEKENNHSEQDLKKAIQWIKKELLIPYDKAHTIAFGQSLLIDKVLEHEIGYKNNALTAIYMSNHFISSERDRARLLKIAVENIEHLIKEGENHVTN